jgi:hypothetical protein
MRVLHYDYGGDGKPELLTVLGLNTDLTICDDVKDSFSYLTLFTTTGVHYATAVWVASGAPSAYQEDVDKYKPDLVAICPDNF